jgi:hypothetical protein
MNKSIRLVLLSAAAAVACQAAPFVAVGDGAELFATGVLGVRADDNILLANSARKISDIILDITPGLELDFGKNAQTQGSLTLADAFAVYTDHSKYNTNLFAGNFVTRYDDGKMKLGFNAGYNELNQNTPDVRGLVRRDVASAGANGEVGVSEISSVGAAVTYSHENYHPANFVDSDTLTVPINFYYKWTPKTDLSLGYAYRDFQANNLAEDSTDHFFNIGARGEFGPKLTGKFAVGYRTINYAKSSSQHAVGLDSSFAYELTPKSALQFGATNDFGTSPTGGKQRNLTINALVTTKLTEEFTANAGVSYRSIHYIAGRTDDYWEGTLGGSYIINANIRLVGAYVYRNYNTDLVGSDFTNNVFSIAANFRY